MEIYYDVKIDTRATTTWNDIDTYFRSLVEDLKELSYNDGVQVWDKHKREYFQLKAILFVTVSDSLAACSLSGQRKK
jgi:hypothetical protein